MEGWEYLSSPIEDENKGKLLEDINRTNPHISYDIKTDFSIPENCKIIDTTESETAILLIGRNQFVVNRFATKKEIKKIIELDK